MTNRQNHWIYPLDIRKGTAWEATFGTRDGRRTFLVRPENLNSRNLRGSLWANWGLSTSFKKVVIGDYVWIYAGWDTKRVLAVGAIDSAPSPTAGNPAYKDFPHPYEVWIRIDNGLTLRLQESTSQIRYKDFKQWVPGAVRPANQRSIRCLQKFLKAAPAISSQDEVVRHSRVEVQQRLGQSEFRADIRAAYGDRCAISGASEPEALVAAHILPVANRGRHGTKNGLLLRADLHNLFDSYRISIDENLRIRVSSTVSDREYQRFHGRKLGLPTSKSLHPDRELLARHFKRFKSVSG